MRNERFVFLPKVRMAFSGACQFGENEPHFVEAFDKIWPIFGYIGNDFLEIIIIFEVFFAILPWPVKKGILKYFAFNWIQ